MTVKRFPLLMIFGFVAINLLSNSCKKEESGTVEALFPGTWQLASLYIDNYSGDTLRTDTINTNCGNDQFFVFNKDNTCTYENYDCFKQTAKGQWQYDRDSLLLKVPNLLCKDTLKGGRDTTYAPFNRLRVVDVGLYSMVIERGERNRFNSNKRSVRRYGFVRIRE